MSRSARLAWIAPFLFMGVGGSAYSQEAKWQRDYAAARAEARESNRPLLIDFGTEHCLWCSKLDVTFRSPAVVKLLGENFVPVKIDAERQPKLAEAGGVHSYPTLLLVRPDGTIAGRREGYADERELVHFLKSMKIDAPAPRPAVRPEGEEADEGIIRCRVTIVGGRDTADPLRSNHSPFSGADR